MWIYQQSTGELTNPSGDVVGTGYSGNGTDLNSPAGQSNIGHGPIPQGYWTIGRFETYPHLGEMAAPLIPQAGNDMDGREGGFFVHGDNKLGNQTASDGCVVLSRGLRQQMSASLDRTLLVIA